MCIRDRLWNNEKAFELLNCFRNLFAHQSFEQESTIYTSSKKAQERASVLVEELEFPLNYDGTMNLSIDKFIQRLYHRIVQIIESDL